MATYTYTGTTTQHTTGHSNIVVAVKVDEALAATTPVVILDQTQAAGDGTYTLQWGTDVGGIDWAGRVCILVLDEDGTNELGSMSNDWLIAILTDLMVQDHQITVLDSSLNQHYVLPPIDITGGFRKEFIVTATSPIPGGEFWIYGDWEDAGLNRSIAVRIFNGTLEFFLSGDGSVHQSISTAYPDDGRAHTLTIELVSATLLSLQVDSDTPITLGTSIISPYTSGNSPILGGRMSDGLNSTWNGAILENKTFVNNSLIRYYPINEDRSGGDVVLKDHSGFGIDGTAVGLTVTSSELYTYNAATTPPQYEDADTSSIIVIGY